MFSLCVLGGGEEMRFELGIQLSSFNPAQGGGVPDPSPPWLSQPGFEKKPGGGGMELGLEKGIGLGE